MKILDTTGDRNDDWLKKAKPEFTVKDREAGKAAIKAAQEKERKSK